MWGCFIFFCRALPSSRPMWAKSWPDVDRSSTEVGLRPGPMWTKLLGRCGAESWPRVCVALFYALSRADFDRGISATTLEKYTKSFVYSSKPRPPAHGVTKC